MRKFGGPSTTALGRPCQLAYNAILAPLPSRRCWGNPSPHPCCAAASRRSPTSGCRRRHGRTKRAPPVGRATLTTRGGRPCWLAVKPKAALASSRRRSPTLVQRHRRRHKCNRAVIQTYNRKHTRGCLFVIALMYVCLRVCSNASVHCGTAV